MTPADAIAALRRAFPAIADEGVERFRRELEPAEPAEPLPTWSFVADHAPPFWALSDDVDVYAEVFDSADRWRWVAWTDGGGRRDDYAVTRDDAMRAAERALGLPECEVVR